MKKFYILLLAVVLGSASFAQLPGGLDTLLGGVPGMDTLLGNTGDIPGLDSIIGTLPEGGVDGERYRDPIFNEVAVVPQLLYGAGPLVFDSVNSLSTVKQPLFMDVYFPLVDMDSVQRPVIVFAFGGAFVYGDKHSPDMVELCYRFAQLGYVTASIDYRLSDELLVNPNAENATRAVLKGTHDMKAAVRYMVRSARDLGNLFSIDTTQIYVGGTSAGAFCALHTAYLDKFSELPFELYDEAALYGGLEGTSGNEGYSSKVAGVLSGAGALGKAKWLEAGDVPIASVHGTADDVVPYDSDTVRILDINYPVDGSAAIHRRADEVGVKNRLHTFIGAGHVPYVGNTAAQEGSYMDTTYNFFREFMYEVVSERLGTSIEKVGLNNHNVVLYPNPVSEVLTVELVGTSDVMNYQVANTMGKVQMKGNITSFQNTINTGELEQGYYFLTIFNGSEKVTKRFVKQ